MNRDNDPRLTNAATPIMLLDANGAAFELLSRPLSDRDMDEIDSWLRQEYLQRLESALSVCEQPATKAMMITQACTLVTNIHFMDGGIGSRMIASVPGLSRLVWQSARADHPKLTYSEVRQLLLNTENRTRAKKTWEDVNLGPTGKPEAKPAETGQQEPKSTAP